VSLPTGERLCLARFHGTIHALGDACTHQAMPLSAGELLPDGTIECPWHGARFDCATGAVQRGPATEPVPVRAVRVVEGRIEVAILR
jgi:3-phenylpropionate/trans-cinnamate dioxygenase ferredoxin subunit